ncbi:MAG TPA: DUF3109 domain-containing protein [Bacteroidales bacterium]|nr:DUF3109 domain-containing protein [Bacteroidales bacterium]
MIAIENTLISEDVVQKQFSCDLLKCHGDCCVEGDAGAPLEIEEISLLEDYISEIIPFMTDEGRKVIEKNGVFDYDMAGEFVTPLVNDRECAFVYFENKIALCAIEKAYREKKQPFLKPISCHLYPIRITVYDQFEAINYHHWGICDFARIKGKQEKKAVYEFLKEPLIRKYGEKWYKTLDEEVKSGKFDELTKR